MCFFFTFLHRQDYEPFQRLSDACSHSVAGISEICCECESYPTRTNPGFACTLNCLDELGHSDHGNILSFVGTWLSNSKTVSPSSHHLWCPCRKSAHVRVLPRSKELWPSPNKIRACGRLMNRLGWGLEWGSWPLVLICWLNCNGLCLFHCDLLCVVIVPEYCAWFITIVSIIFVQTKRQVILPMARWYCNDSNKVSQGFAIMPLCTDFSGEEEATDGAAAKFPMKVHKWNPQLCWQTCFSQAQLKLMFDELDEDGSGELTLDEINAAPPVTWAKQVKKVQSQVFRCWYVWLPDVFPFAWPLWF